MKDWQAITSVVFLCSIGLTGAVALIVWHLDKNTEFNMRQALVDSVTNKVSVEKIGFMVALATTSWGLVHLTLMDKLTEWFVFAYLTIFATTRVASQGIAVFKDVFGKKDQPNA